MFIFSLFIFSCFFFKGLHCWQKYYFLFFLHHPKIMAHGLIFCAFLSNFQDHWARKQFRFYLIKEIKMVYVHTCLILAQILNRLYKNYHSENRILQKMLKWSCCSKVNPQNKSDSSRTEFSKCIWIAEYCKISQF